MTIYRIELSGHLDTHWISWFEPLEITTEHNGNGRPVTVLTGPVSDPSELRGLLAKIWDLNMELISLKQIDQESLSGGTSHE
jgi:hypothetical protein